MNNWLYKLERKYGRRFGIHNLMMYVVATMLAVYLADMFTGISRYMTLSWGRVLSGEVWRLLTFAALPPTLSTGYFSLTNSLLLAIGLYVYYFIGNSLENAWGTFSFNLYYLCGVLSAILAAVFTGYGDNTYLNLSLLFAFACFFPDTQFRLYFLIPIKVKHIAYIDAAFFLITFIRFALAGYWAGCLSIVAALLNFFLFFGPDLLRKLRDRQRHSAARKRFRKNDNDFWR